MLIHSLNPVFLQIGPFSIYYYSLMYILGFIIIYYMLYRHREEFKLNKEDIENFVVYLMLGVILGGRLFEVLVWNPAYYFSNLSKIIAVWEGGMSLHGGIIGVIIAGYYFCKKKNISFWKMADFLVVPAAFAIAFGRIGNFINGELVGIVTDVPWCFVFPGYSGCRHPVQLYGAAGRFTLSGILFLMSKKVHKEGYLFWMFMLLMGIGRFFSDFLREDILYWGLSTGQWLSLLVAGIAVVVLVKKYRK